MTTTNHAPGTWKVRRESLGSNRAPGWELQTMGRRVRRATAHALGIGPADATLSGLGGLVSFNSFLQREKLGETLRAQFGHLKTGRRVVYPMATQIQLLLDASLAGASRVFDMEWLAADPVFVHLAGGAVPSVDTLYDDLQRFGPEELELLEALIADHGLRPVREKRWRELTVDIDTTVTPLFGEQEGARPGPNPRYHGRPSYHPLLIRVAETNTLIGVRLRPGDTGFGVDDVRDIEIALDRLREACGPTTVITVRIDAAGDCVDVLNAIHAKGAHFVVKAKQGAKMLGAVWATKRWNTVDTDADGKPTRQVAEIDFQRPDWPAGRFRVFAVRTTERLTGRQTHLWDDLEWSVQMFITNDPYCDFDDLAHRYNDRAGIEPLIGELKAEFGIGKVSNWSFDANEAAFLIKALAYNLMRRWVATCHAAAACWRAGWIRRACVCVPARLLRSGGRWVLRLAPRPMLN